MAEAAKCAGEDGTRPREGVLLPSRLREQVSAICTNSTRRYGRCIDEGASTYIAGLAGTKADSKARRSGNTDIGTGADKGKLSRG